MTPGSDRATAPAPAPRPREPKSRLARARRVVRLLSLERRVAIAAVTGLALLTAALFIGLGMTRQKPRWWREVDLASPALAQLGERVERGAMNTLHGGVRGEAPWTVAVTVEQANAWMNARLPKWLENRQYGWPSDIEELQADFSGGRLRIGVRVDFDGSEQVVVATVAPEVRQGALWLPITAARAGRLDLPAGWSIDRLRERLPERVKARPATALVLDALAGKAPLMADAAIELEDGRRVRILAVGAEGNQLMLTCKTE